MSFEEVFTKLPDDVFYHFVQNLEFTTFFAVKRVSRAMAQRFNGLSSDEYRKFLLNQCQLFNIYPYAHSHTIYSACEFTCNVLKNTKFVIIDDTGIYETTFYDEFRRIDQFCTVTEFNRLKIYYKDVMILDTKTYEQFPTMGFIIFRSITIQKHHLIVFRHQNMLTTAHHITQFALGAVTNN